MKTQSKKYGKLANKTWLAEHYFIKNPHLTNDEIARIISREVSETSKRQVDVIRSRWKSKMQKAISSKLEISTQTLKIITSKDFQQSFFDAFLSIGDQIHKRIEKLNNVELIYLFSVIMKIFLREISRPQTYSKITSVDVQQILLGVCVSINDEITKRADDFKNKELIYLFSVIMKLVGTE